MAVNPHDRPSGPESTRPGDRREGSTRPREAPRPGRRSSTTDSTGISLCPATFVALSPEQERRAVEALAELLVPLLTEAQRSRTRRNTDPIFVSGAAAILNLRSDSHTTTHLSDHEPCDSHMEANEHPQGERPTLPGSASEQGPALLRE